MLQKYLEFLGLECLKQSIPLESSLLVNYALCVCEYPTFLFLNQLFDNIYLALQGWSTFHIYPQKTKTNIRHFSHSNKRKFIFEKLSYIMLSFDTLCFSLLDAEMRLWRDYFWVMKFTLLDLNWIHLISHVF